MSMVNAKAELLAALSELPQGVCIVAAVVEHDHYSCEAAKVLLLPKGHTAEQLEAFLASLDFEYDSGFGTQEIFGTVWLSDGSWLFRGEYDGSEWWERRFAPPIPPELAGGESH